MRIPSAHNFAVACIMLIALTAVVSACSSDTYDAGDGIYSYLRADFADVSTDAHAQAYLAITDDDVMLSLSPAIATEWANRPDTTYRALLYYNIPKDNGGASAGTTCPDDSVIRSCLTVEPKALASVLVPRVSVTDINAQQLSTDPLDLETSWLSNNGRYLNFGINVKTGQEDGTVERQQIGAAYTGIETTESGKNVHHIVLLHDQNGVPEYYSTHVYVSIPLRQLPFAVDEGDEIDIAVNTYSGIKDIVFTLPAIEE